jgi:hypothetical protein
MAITRHIEINHDQEPVRLFKSDFLEFFTHIHPAVVLIIWLPVALILLFRAHQSYSASSMTNPWHIPLGNLLGLFLWSLTEYALHRFVFHFRPRTPWQEKLAFLFHGVQDSVSDATRRQHSSGPALLRRFSPDPDRSLGRIPLARAHLCWIHHRLFGLRHAPLRHPPHPNAPGRLEDPETPPL